MANHIICMEFGPFIIKICEVKPKKKNQIEAVRTTLLQTPSCCVENGYVSITDELVSPIREVLNSWGCKNPDLYISLQTDNMLYRTRHADSIPNIPVFIKEQKEFFANKNAPYEIYVFRDSSDALTDVIGVPSNIFDCYIDLALCLNARLKGIVDTQYVLRHNLQTKQNANHLLIDISEERLIASLGSKQHIQAIKSAPHSIFPAMFTIKKYSGEEVDMIRALELLRQISEDSGYGLDAAAIIRELNAYIESLAQTIKNTIQDLRIAADLPFDTIVISGFIADMPYLFKRLKQLIDYPVVSYKSVDNKSLHTDKTGAVANTFASCIRAFNTINFLTPEILNTERYKQYKKNEESKSLFQKLFS